MNGPVAMTIGPGDSLASEDLYVSDCFTHRVLRYDGVTREFKSVFVAAGSGGLQQPHGLTFGPDGNLYVASFSSDQVLRYDGTTGAFLGVFALGSGGVTDVAFGPDGNLYATNRYAGKVTRHDGTTGAYLDDFVPAGSGGWNTLYYLTFRPDGYLYVNTQGGSVLRYDGTTGAFVDQFAAGQIGPSIAFGPDGDLYVQSANGVQRYSGTTGAFIGTFVSPGSGGLIGPSGMAFDAHKLLTLDFAPNAHGTATITLRATDPLGAWQDTQFTVVVAPVNDAPSAVDDYYQFTPGDAYPSAPGVLGNDSDIDGDSLTAVLDAGPQHGSVELQPDGSFVYTPDPGFFGSDQFTYVASDGELSSAPATVALRVSPVRLVKDINTVEDGFFNTEHHRRAVVGSQVFFAADDASHGLELWVTDGTAAGTRLVKDLYPGVTSSDPALFTVYNNLLYFVATDPDKGRELWRSDGTAAGTVVVKDIHTAGNTDPDALAVYKGLLYFRAYQPDTGHELWRTDGTADGTVLFKDINPGTGSSSPGTGVVSGNYMFFTADNGVTGPEPWRTDGTEAGTIFLEGYQSHIGTVLPAQHDQRQRQVHVRSLRGT